MYHGCSEVDFFVCIKRVVQDGSATGLLTLKSLIFCYIQANIEVRFYVFYSILASVRSDEIETDQTKADEDSDTKREIENMAKRRGNPNWGKPEPIGPVTPTVTSFEQVVKEYKLTPDQYVRSTRLREWARRNKNSKYIPEALLEAWGFEIESTL